MIKKLSNKSKWHTATKLNTLLYTDGIILVQEGKYKEALAIANKYLYFDKPYLKSGRWLKEICLKKMGKYVEAFEVLDKRLLFDPNDVIALQSMIQLISWTGKLYQSHEAYEIALKYCNKFIRVANKKKSISTTIIYTAYLNKARTLYWATKYSQAMRYYEKAIKAPTTYWTYEYIKKIYDIEGMYCREKILGKVKKYQ
jgi:tetratricopeptide (TPR) repeat protein